MPTLTRSPAILFVDQSGEMGGAELSLLDIARHYSDKGRVTLFSDGVFRERLESHGVDVGVMSIGAAGSIERDSRLLGALSNSPSLIKAVIALASDARSFDLIYANTQKAFVVAAFASVLARRPLIWHLRDILTADHFSSSLRKLVITLANRCASCVIANSQATADAFRDAGGICEIHVIHNGIDAAPFESIDRPRAKQALRTELGVDSPRLIGVFSRLAEWKGQHILIEALRNLPHVHAVFVGGALFGEHAYESKLRQLSQDAQVDNRCHFLGFRHDIPSLMAGVDIVAHTSITPEPFGRVIVEGMLSGNPVIAARGGGVSEIIEPGKDGILIEPNNPQLLRQAIQDLALSPERYDSVARYGMTKAHEKFSLAACLAGVDAAVGRVLCRTG